MPTSPSARRRRVWAREYLGNKCAYCDTTEALEFDHIDESTKAFSISTHLDRRLDVLQKELDKCQLLCASCHKKKTLTSKAWARLSTEEVEDIKGWLSLNMDPKEIATLYDVAHTTIKAIKYGYSWKE